MSSDLGLRFWRVRFRWFGDTCLRWCGLDHASILSACFPPIPARPPWFLRGLIRRALRRATPTADDLQALKIVYGRGAPIFVLQKPSVLNLFCLAEFVRFHGLTRLGHAFGIRLSWMQPVKVWITQVLAHGVFWLVHARSPHAIDDLLFEDLLKTDQPLVLFARQTFHFRDRGRQFAGRSRRIRSSPIQEYLRVFLRARRWQESSCHRALAAFSVIWDTEPRHFGQRRATIGVFLERLLSLWTNTNTARYRPQFFVRLPISPEPGGMNVRVDEKRLRKTLNQCFEELELVVRGPRGLPHARIIRELCRDPAIAHAEQKFLKKRGKSPLLEFFDLRAPAKAYLTEMVGCIQRWVLRVFEQVIRSLLSRNCEGIVYDQDGVANLRAILAKGNVVLVPNHRSHLDYLLVSYVLFRNQLPVPNICAGDNLNFWPIGALFRRAGAYFIRRSFDENTLYPVVLKRYLRFLSERQVLQEFFIEGGRSRTGKIRLPMLGILSLMTQVALENQRDLYFMPLSIQFDRLPEERAIARESMGRRKKSERLMDLWKIARLRKTKIGKIYFRFGQPLSLVQALAEDGLQGWKVPDHARRKTVTKAARTIAAELKAGTMLTATGVLALILLAIPDGDVYFVSRAEILELSEILLAWAKSNQGDHSLQVFTVYETLEAGMTRALALFEHAGLIECQNSREVVRVRMEDPEVVFCLDYYRNSILHLYLPQIISAVALLPHGRKGLAKDACLCASAEIAHFLGEEHTVSRNALERAIADLVKENLVLEEKGILQIASRDWAAKRLFQLRACVLGSLSARLATTEVILQWLRGQEVFLEDALEEGLVRRILSTMGPSVPMESRSWYQVINALDQLVENQLLYVRHERRGRAILRRFSVEGWGARASGQTPRIETHPLEDQIQKLRTWVQMAV